MTCHLTIATKKHMDSGASSSSSSGGVVLDGKDDRYGGFIIDPQCLPSDPSAFVHSLRHSLGHWKSQSKKGIWLKIPIEKSNLVHPAVKEGFGYHHAEQEYLMLTYWIPELLSSTLPSNASHQVGVGAVIINDQNEILVVQERSGPTQGSGVWKMPTGVVLQGEDIKDGVTREVKEETGVDTEFVEVLGFRQAHDVAFGKSDLFFLCKLRPLSSQIVVQETEIAAAKWMPLNEFSDQAFNTASDLLTRISEIANASVEENYRGFRAETLAFGFRKKGSYFYHNIQDIHEFKLHKSSKV